MRVTAPLLAAALLAWPLAACQSYNQRVKGPVGAFERGDFTSAETGFTDVNEGFLRGAEAGMSAFADGRFLDARRHFNGALDASDEILERAALGAENAIEGVLTLAINEGQADYAGEGYERVMLHVMLALTYLAEGDAEGVLVESRRVDDILTQEEELYDTDYGAGGIGHLLSAVAYELTGRWGDAYIDYQRLADKELAPHLVGPALARLSRRLGRSSDIARWESIYGPAELPPDGAGTIVLIAGLGMGPAKREIKIDIPVKGGVFSWAVPEFGSGSGLSSGLALVFPGSGVRVESDMVEDVASVSKENLSDRIALIAARSAARGLMKRQLADQMRDNPNGDALGLIADMFTIFSERADLRAWRTLPRQWVAARAFLPAGEFVEIELAETGGALARVPLGAYRVAEGETMFVLARALDSGIVAHVIGGELPPAPQIDPPPGAAAPAPNQAPSPAEPIGNP